MKNKTRWLIIAVIVLALIAGIWRALASKRAQKEAAAAPAVVQTHIELANSDVLTASVRDITQGLAISGTVKALNYAVIKARVAGEIKDITVREGDAVTAGQVLARIDPTEYQRRWQQAQEQALAAKAQMEIAQRQWDINKALVAQGFISKIASDNSLASYQGALASHKAAIAGADVARKSLDDATLVAPFSGVIALRAAQLGERVSIDAKILELVDLRQLEVEAPLSPSDSIDVRVGQVATLQLEDRPTYVKAKVQRISPSAQAGSRSVMVYLRLDQPQGLRHGLFAKGTLGLGKSQVMAVPLSAVRSDRAQPYVQVVEKVGDTFQVAHKTVVVGVTGTDLAQPESEPWVGVTGLDAGRTVIKGQVGALRQGLAVTYTSPKTN
ncbi:efflux transporter periplasmic adaptor subunit [Limnohabitans sp. TS-CS-82]|uniref:efflux RND transporter periplasmic adaptor subunit n=1 Tax=Limnohabitans sp. TS-CS-82 TaxID=2094193 RepID=UPI000CF26408|nr:efflux RND transporter periplasmic adaptor subunit [Limnohabitans sp. TS-CS-82]PQA83361.1 efflux transporter periplasmic adaptor subunit [Limnohabitans sp. TS-CS-82]